MEIERKFLVKELPFEIATLQSKHITQHYLSLIPEQRIRDINGVYYYTKKSEGLYSREEKEKGISLEEYTSLVTKSVSFLKKRRYYYVLDQDIIAEIDVFQDHLKGLKIVEVEFASEEAADKFSPPSWFGIEVTNDQRYRNKNLSIRGIPKELRDDNE